MKNANKIVHLSDIHIPNNTKRHDEFRIQFNKTYLEIDKIHPDIIVIVGDLFNDFIEITNEAKALAGEFLHSLLKYTNEIVIVPGNHDIRKASLNRLDSVGTIVKILKNNKITYFNKSGFFNDTFFDNIVWVNHSHLEKNINPWNDKSYVKIPNKIYIDLYHDPISNCILSNGYKYKDAHKDVNEFNGDLGFFGDIHVFQYLNEDKTYAYSSSLIQQNFGESVDGHGFLSWDLNNKTSEFHQIDSDYSLVNIVITPDTDYNNIQILNNNIKENSQFKILWEDYDSNKTIENEMKIRRSIEKAFNKQPVKWEKKSISPNIDDTINNIDHNVSLQDRIITEQIFKEYLESKKYSSDDINHILELDKKIDTLIDNTEIINNIEYSIDKIWFDNFKCYGDYFEIPWKDLNGIIQINGDNRQGKSTIFDVITFVLYGTTLFTHKLGGGKKEKFSDARYINNKRDLNYCRVGCDIVINGEIYKIERKIERKIEKKEIKSVTSVLSYLDVNGIPLTEERKIKTQKYFDKILGSFEDFIRLAFTNADNLNNMLSMDRANFIDNILRDAGLDLFEIKLELFKKYKKTFDTERLSLIPWEEDSKISTLQDEIKVLDNDIQKHDMNIDKINNEIDVNNNIKDEILKKINPIDQEIANLNLNDIEVKLAQVKDKITINIQKQKSYQEKIEGLKTNFDEKRYESLFNLIQNNKEQQNDLKLKIKDSDIKKNNEINKLEKIDNKISDLVKIEIKKIDDSLTFMKNDLELESKDFDNLVKNQYRTLEEKSQDYINQLKINDVNCKNLQLKYDDLNTEINNIKSSSHCPLCGTELSSDSKHIEKHLNEKINELNLIKPEIDEIQKEKNNIQKQLDEIEYLILELKNKNWNLFTLLNDTYNKLNESKNNISKKTDEYSLIINKISENDYSVIPVLQEKNSQAIILKNNCNALIKKYDNDNVQYDNDIQNLIKEQRKLEKEFNTLDKEKVEVKEYNLLSSELDNLKLEHERFKISIEKFNILYAKYEQYQQIILDNKKYQNELMIIENIINDLDVNVQNIITLNQKNKIDIELKRKELNEKQIILSKYLEQEKRDRLFNVYQDCISRDGIPTHLLKKSLHKINQKISHLLNEVDFIVYFNDDVQLKMSDKGKEQNSLESSGIERVIIALALKYALRSINTKSKPNFLLLDEIFGKAKNEYVDVVINMLQEMKKEIKQIFIVEHKENINYDSLIDVNKDKQGVSTITIKNI